MKTYLLSYAIMTPRGFRMENGSMKRYDDLETVQRDIKSGDQLVTMRRPGADEEWLEHIRGMK